jgi:hypothetical protein
VKVQDAPNKAATHCCGKPHFDGLVPPNLSKKYNPSFYQSKIVGLYKNLILHQ